MQAELVKRVMALEDREETLRVNNAKLENTIEALDECTGVSRAEIVAIAQELSRSAASNDEGICSNGAGPHRKKPTLSQAVGIVITVACVAVTFKLLTPMSDTTDQILIDGKTAVSLDAKIRHSGGTQSGRLPEDTASIYETYQRKAELASAMSDVSALRMALVEHYYMNGEHPDSLEELGYGSGSLTSNNVAGVTLEREGTLLVHLPDTFGIKKRMKLAPGFAMGGTIIQWDCIANLPATVLTGLNCKQG